MYELAADLAMEEGTEVFEARLDTEWTKRVGEAATALLIVGPLTSRSRSRP